MTFTHLDLFAGIGGFSRAVHWLGGTTVGFVEWDAWNRRVLAKHWPEAHFHGDIKTFTAATLRDWGIRSGADDVSGNTDQDIQGADGEVRSGANSESTGIRRQVRQPINLITGGYPCQPFSLAGQRLGAADDRHLWPEMRRVIDLCRPRFVLAENVAGHITMGLDTVLAELEEDGYTCGAIVVPACAVNALHRRDRVWIMAAERGSLAHPESGIAGQPTERQGRQGTRRGSDDLGGDTGTGRIQIIPNAAARGIRRGGPSGDERQPALSGEGVGDATRVDDREQPDHGIAVAPERHARMECGGTGSGHDGRPDTYGLEAPRPLDAGADELSAGLVRRPATGPTEPDLIRAAWADGSWEHDLPRVVADEPDRRQKLQAAGNAIVPLVAYEILSVMLQDAA